jgi:H+/Cl- antiporter ClcA
VSTGSPQPNVPGRGIVASYRVRFWVLVALVGLGAGLGGAALITLLRAVQHLAWGYHSGPFLAAVQRDSSTQRLLVLLIGGLVAGGGGLALARAGAGGGEVTEAIWLRGARLPLLGSLLRAVHSIVIVALGASLGREAAPQLAGAAFASTISERARVPEWQRRLLVACGAGAGMAAVYNVPLGGALFALEVLLGTLTLPLVLPALATSLIATAVAWIALPTSPTYAIPSYQVHASQIVWALWAGPLAGLVAIAWNALIKRAHMLRPRRPALRLAAPVIVFGALGALAISYPQLLGNGKPVVQLALVGGLGIGLLAVLLVLKPLVTAACLGSGAPGGLFTPTLALGVLLGGVLGYGWNELWPGAPLGGYAIIGGAAVLGASMQGPLAAIVLLLELTHHGDALMVPILLAVVEATVLARVLGAPSIYSARIALAGAHGLGPEPGERAAEPREQAHTGPGDAHERPPEAPSDHLPESLQELEDS